MAPGRHGSAATANRCFQFFDVASFAEQLLVHEHFLVKIREEMPLETAALIGCGVTTGVGAVINTAQVRPGDTVAVIGCGGIGLNAVQAASIVGASRVIAIDRLASKLEMARSFGATDVIDASTTDAVAAVKDLTSGGVDHSFEAIGLKSTAEQAFEMLGKGGTATIIGMVPFGQKIELDVTGLLSGKRIQGSNMGSNRFRIDMPRYVDWYLAGKLKLDELVSATMTARRHQRWLRGAGHRRSRPPARRLRPLTDHRPDGARRATRRYHRSGLQCGVSYAS